MIVHSTRRVEHSATVLPLLALPFVLFASRSLARVKRDTEAAR